MQRALMSAAAASAACCGAPPPRGDEALDDCSTQWCSMPLGYKRYLLSRGVGTSEPRKYSEIMHPVAATLGFAALHLGSQRGGARAQVFDWNGISVKQYEAQLAYESWQKDDTTYSEWAYKNGYLECDDDMQGILASVDNGVYTCDALVLLMECETDLSAGLIPSLPQNTTGADLCPLSCDACIVPGFVFDDIAVVYSTSMCSMCAQGGDSTFAWMKHPQCRDYTSTKTGGPCFPKWEVGCPLQCAQVRASASPAPRSRLRIALPLCRAHRSHAQSWLCVQWFDRRIVTRTENGGILWAYLTEDGRWCAPLSLASRASC